MSIPKRVKKALGALNLDLFRTESITPPAPATLYTKIREQAKTKTEIKPIALDPPGEDLPPVEALYLLFDRFNWMYFEGRLPQASIEYSTRMTSAGSYTPSRRLIRIGHKYHTIFPEDLHDTLKHEMIHMIHLRHDAKFKAEATRVGASLRARSHPNLRKTPKYLYLCPGCRKEYPRQKRFRLASCGDCSQGGKFDARFKLKLKKSKPKEQIDC